MGKGKKKKQRVDYDELFRSEPKRTEEDWYTSLTALDLDDDEPRKLRHTTAATAGGPAAAGPTTAEAAAAAGDGMDTSEAVPVVGKKRRKLGVKLAPMKSSRGQRTTAQRKRKSSKQEKALARAEKAAVKVTKQSKRKLRVAALKTLY